MTSSTVRATSWREVARQIVAQVMERRYRLAMRRLKRRTPENTRQRPIIVTLSTTPKRLFHKTDVAIATLMLQKLRPDRIILWLSDALQHQPLPDSFRCLIDAGLDVQYRCDVGPHTKLFYALQEYPDCVLVSVDDDTLYPDDWLGKLVASYTRAPQHIHAHRAHLMRKNSEGKLAPYNEWQLFAPGLIGPSHLLFPTGVGGILYPPHSLAPDVFDVAAFRRLCPLADDIWFKAMAVLQGTLCQKAAPHRRQPLPIHGSQEESLFSTNITRNDAQVAATFDAYDLYGRL